MIYLVAIMMLGWSVLCKICFDNYRERNRNR